ncbi:Rdx family protein [Pseudalkalibacillus sp. SCS-8]
MTSLDLIPSSGGAFEVTVNGTKLYSKLDTGEFPDNDKLFADIEKLNR